MLGLRATKNEMMDHAIPYVKIIHCAFVEEIKEGKSIRFSCVTFRKYKPCKICDI